MKTHIEELLRHSVPITSVRPNGKLTSPPSWGVYELEQSNTALHSRRFRFGNHPIRQHELIAEYNSAKLIALFAERKIALELARALNYETAGNSR